MCIESLATSLILSKYWGPTYGGELTSLRSVISQRHTTNVNIFNAVKKLEILENIQKSEKSRTKICEK